MILRVYVTAIEIQFTIAWSRGQACILLFAFLYINNFEYPITYNLEMFNYIDIWFEIKIFETDENIYIQYWFDMKFKWKMNVKEILLKAVNCDKHGRRIEAYNHYLDGVEMLMALVEGESNTNYSNISNIYK